MSNSEVSTPPAKTCRLFLTKEMWSSKSFTSKASKALRRLRLVAVNEARFENLAIVVTAWKSGIEVIFLLWEGNVPYYSLTSLIQLYFYPENCYSDKISLLPNFL